MRASIKVGSQRARISVKKIRVTDITPVPSDITADTTLYRSDTTTITADNG